MTKQISKKTIPKSQLTPKSKNEDYRKVYYPYIVVVAIAVISLFAAPLFGLNRVTSTHLPNSKSDVLSYATSLSQSDLLSLTNERRSSAGAASLSMNSKLNSAAQSKANDMVARNYWAHNTPDGQAPWVFITNAGYSYTKAAENLASGFDTSSAVIQGWIDSSPHRTAMLSTDYTEVGFGFANSPNFTDQGESTVVVAMYAAPYQAPAPAPTPTPTPTTAQSTPTTPSVPPKSTTPAVQETSPQTPAPTAPSTQNTEPTIEQNAETVPSDTNQDEEKTEAKDIPFTTESSSTILSKDINRIDQKFRQYAPFAGAGLIATTILTGLFWLYKHSKAFHKKVIQGEKYVLTHKYVDVLFVVLIITIVYLFQRVGTIL